MQELTDKQRYEALHYAKSQDEQAGKAILERFQASQTAFGKFQASCRLNVKSHAAILFWLVASWFVVWGVFAYRSARD